MLRFFKVQIEPTDSQKRQAPLWIRETKPRMMITLLNLCKKLFKKFIWAKTGQRIFEAKTTAFTTSSGACAVLRYRSNPLQEKGTASELFLSCQPSSKRSDFKITLFTQFSTDFHAQQLKITVLRMCIRYQKLIFACLFVQQPCIFKEGSIFRTITALNLQICYFSECSAMGKRFYQVLAL